MNKKTLNKSLRPVGLAVLLLFVFSASVIYAEDLILKTVGPDEFFIKLEENRDMGKGILIDVRTPGEYSQGSAPTSINIDFYETDFHNMIETLDKEKTYFIYCQSGNRSGRTLKLMKSLGFQEVYDLSGGWSGNSSRLLSVETQ